MPPRDLGRLMMVALVLLLVALAALLSGCQTAGETRSVWDGANQTCQTYGWQSTRCAYAQNQAHTRAQAIGGVAAARSLSPYWRQRPFPTLQPAPQLPLYPPRY